MGCAHAHLAAGDLTGKLSSQQSWSEATRSLKAGSMTATQFSMSTCSTRYSGEDILDDTDSGSESVASEKPAPRHRKMALNEHDLRVREFLLTIAAHPERLHSKVQGLRDRDFPKHTDLALPCLTDDEEIIFIEIAL
mmetsp:Transcript_9767/g.17636  ORF Transcript_9767/g.17636 Transcript_9767/m.17636 type:complete len:137 (-) Transcript_9767:226-636(-)